MNIYVAALTFAMYMDDSGTSPDQMSRSRQVGLRKPPHQYIRERDWDEAEWIQSDKFEVTHMADFVGKNAMKDLHDGAKVFTQQKSRVVKKITKILHKRVFNGFGISIIEKDFNSSVPVAVKTQGYKKNNAHRNGKMKGDNIRIEAY